MFGARLGTVEYMSKEKDEMQDCSQAKGVHADGAGLQRATVWSVYANNHSVSNRHIL